MNNINVSRYYKIQDNRIIFELLKFAGQSWFLR